MPSMVPEVRVLVNQPCHLSPRAARMLGGLTQNVASGPSDCKPIPGTVRTITRSVTSDAPRVCGTGRPRGP